jgi:DNA-directed RNA polymerase subunit beta
MVTKRVTRSYFGVKTQTFPVPDLNAMQVESCQFFWKNELQKILGEFSPVVDQTGGRWRVSIGPDFYLEKDDKMNEYTALLEGRTYSAPLFVNVGVENLISGEKKLQRIFVANVPLMTQKGNFIINGIQKIVVSQLIKSPGLLYTRDLEKGNLVYTTRIIPTRGIWIDLELGGDNVIYARVDRKKKFPVTQLFKLFGLESEEQILNLFRDVDIDERISYIQATLNKDQSSSSDDAVNLIYRKIRPGDIVSIEQGRKFLRNLFEDPAKYDFGSVGRYKFDARLNLKSTPEGSNEYKHTLSVDELVAAVRELVSMVVHKKDPDNIDSLANRRVRGVGEWLGNTFKAGLARVVRNTREKMTLNDDVNFTPAQLVNMRPLAAMIEDFFNTSQLSRFMDQTNLMSEMDQRQFMTCSGPGGLTRERAGFEVRDVQPSYYGRICPVNTPEGPGFGLNLHAAVYARINKMGFMETPYFRVKTELKATDEELITRIASEDLTVKGQRVVKNGQMITKDVWEDLNANHPSLSVKVKRFVSGEIVWLSSEEEAHYIIASYTNNLDENGHFLIDTIGARKEGNPVQVDIFEVDLMDVSANQIFSLSTCLVPFAAQTEGMRVLMGTNQQGQALPLVRPEVPLVATGFEKIAADYSGYMSVAESDGVVEYADSRKVIVKNTKTNQEIQYSALKFLPSNESSTINQRVVVTTGTKVKKGDILIEGFGVHQGEFAIGQNVRVAFMSFKGYNYEDAIVLSERLVQDDKFTSTHIHELVCDVHETRIGDEEITRDIPNVAADKLSKLSEDGIIHLGAFVESGDILVGKITPKGEVDLSPEDKLIRVLFGEYSRDVKDSSLYLQHGLTGKVVSIRVISREDNNASLPNDVIRRVHIWLAETRKIKPGDKMAGRHGNKGVVSVVLPVEDMPFTADGKPIDVILNPLGVVGRMNLGQLLETHLGLVCDKIGAYAVTQPLNEIPFSTIQEELVQAGFDRSGKLDLWDGQTGERYERPVTVGYLYINKLHHMVDDKMHARSTGPYSLVTQQPLGGRSHSGGQRFGEMECWALQAYGAAHALQEMLTIKADDVQGREDAFESIIRGKQINTPNLPSSFIVLGNELTALGIKVNAQVVAAEEKYIDTKLALSADMGTLDK